MSDRGQTPTNQSKKYVLAWLRLVGACAYCGRKMDISVHKLVNEPPQCPEFGTVLWTLEHVRPHARNGPRDRSNLVVVCAPCNHSRGSLSLHFFRLAYPGGFWIETEGIARLNDVYPPFIEWLRADIPPLPASI
jgi:5-methylcytosine-specific restriction endonuclease McrA